MASISNVTLALQKIHNQNGGTRRATVTFTTLFSSADLQSNALFTSDVKLQGLNSATGHLIADTLNMGNISILASASPLTTTLTKTFQRANLDDNVDGDIVITDPQHGREYHYYVENVDEWRADVTLVPQIQNVVAHSSIVTGSWGLAGHD